jgi:HK97 family phage portal protein
MGVGVKWIMRQIGRAAGGVKAFTMRWAGYGAAYVTNLLPRSLYNYAAEIGDGSRSNIVQAVVLWMARTFPEAPVIVIRTEPDGTEKTMVESRLPRLIEKPNPYYSGVLMWMATIVDWSMSGNAYWLKRRSEGGTVAELWWAPSWTVEPKWPDDGSAFISHYEYRPNSEIDPAVIQPEDIVHFRYGLDPYNTRKGCSPLRSLMREIFTDEEASNFTAQMMTNFGVPGIVVSPDPAVGSITVEQAQQTEQVLAQKFTGDGRGRAMVQTAPTKVQVLSFSPEQMMLRDLRRVPEERVTAVYGVAAVVVGLGAGLDRATFTNFAEAREAAYEGNVIPTQRMFAADLSLQLLPDFVGNRDDMRVAFDITKVRVLQPDMDKMATRMSQGVRDGWVMVAEAKRAMSLPVTSDDEIYLRAQNVTAVGPDNEPVLERPALPSPNGNGVRELVA